ncbi:MAG TPA: TonB-dependent receptor [Gemmatimonadales bacterium]|nr:TonB-dependent receptor [Gemmatimonadales bacterium]
MTKLTLLIAPLAIAALAVARPLAAQQPSDSAARARADSINRARQAALQARVDSVEKARQDSLRRYRLAAVVVTATRLSPIDERSPAQVEQLNMAVAVPVPIPNALPNALLQLPGVNVFDDQGTPLQPEIQIRGFTVSGVVGQPQGVSVFLNGVRMNEPDAQEVNFDMLPMEAISATSVVRGSNVLFGRNSLGGTVLLSTPRGTDTPQAEFEGGGGSFGGQMLSFNASGKAGGVDAFVAGTGNNLTGWRQVTEGRTRNVFMTLGHQWGATHDSGDVAIDFMYNKDRIEEAGSLPSSYATLYPRLNYTGGDFFGPEAYTVDLRGNQPLGGGLFRGTVFWRRNYYEQFNGNVPPPNTDGFIHNLSRGGTLEWSRPIAGNMPISLTFGADFQWDDVNFHLLNVPAGPGSQPDSTTTLAQISPQANLAGYAQAAISLTPKLTLTAGARFDHVDIPYVDQLNDSNSATNSYDRLSPEAGLTYEFTPDVKGFIAYRSGFRAPAPLELACANPDAPCSLPSALGADPPLAPVTSQDFEGGVDLDLGHRSSLDLNGYFTNVSNDILFASPDLTHVYFVNVPQTRRAGFEASLQVGLPDGFRIFGSYSFVRATYQSVIQLQTADTAPAPTEPGDIFPNSPLHRLRAGLGIDRAFGKVTLNAEWDVRAYSSFYVQGDESNQRPQEPGYAVSGIRGKLGFNRFSINFQLENIFNASYMAYGIEATNGLFPPGSQIALDDFNSAPDRFLTPGMPRRFFLSLSARL